MRIAHVVCAAMAGVGVLASAVARAQSENAPAAPDRALALMAHVGIGTPVGFVGGAAEVAPARWFVLSAGGGVTFGGPQWAVMARVRKPNDFLGLSAGLSGGPYSWTSDQFALLAYRTNKHWTQAFWLNTEVSIENHSNESLRLRGYIGLAILLNPNAWATCTRDPTVTGSPVVLIPGDAPPCTTPIGPFLYAGMSFGPGFVI